MLWFIWELFWFMAHNALLNNLLKCLWRIWKGNKVPVGGHCCALQPQPQSLFFSECYCMPPTVPGAPAAPRGLAASALGLWALERSWNHLLAPSVSQHYATETTSTQVRAAEGAFTDWLLICSSPPGRVPAAVSSLQIALSSGPPPPDAATPGGLQGARVKTAGRQLVNFIHLTLWGGTPSRWSSW